MLFGRRGWPAQAACFRVCNSVLFFSMNNIQKWFSLNRLVAVFFLYIKDVKNCRHYVNAPYLGVYCFAFGKLLSYHIKKASYCVVIKVYAIRFFANSIAQTHSMVGENDDY